MEKITPMLWFDDQAEAAAAFYVSLFPDSRINRIRCAAADNPSTSQGAVLTVEFILSGRPFTALNGGPYFKFNEAVSFVIDCADQHEVDYYWDSLVRDGGSEGRCGWCKDRFGVSWQVVPRALVRWLTDDENDKAARTMKVMMTMNRLDVATLEAAYNGAT
ncbi:MAG: VOC family protein [Gammaproteobacteria bacterium]|nr:VOC family protein [Gammaproteobacteria bacterium]